MPVTTHGASGSIHQEGYSSYEAESSDDSLLEDWFDCLSDLSTWEPTSSTTSFSTSSSSFSTSTSLPCHSANNDLYSEEVGYNSLVF